MLAGGAQQCCAHVDVLSAPNYGLIGDRFSVLGSYTSMATRINPVESNAPDERWVRRERLLCRRRGGQVRVRLELTQQFANTPGRR